MNLEYPLFYNLAAMKNVLKKGRWWRKISYIFFCLIMLVNNLVYCQQDTMQKKIQFILKADVFFPIARAINYLYNPDDFVRIESLTFETCFAHRHSVQITGLIYKEDIYSPIELQIMTEYKFYLMKRKPYCGFYVGACLKYIQNRNPIWTSTQNQYYAYEYSIGEDVIAGYQNLIGKHFVYDILIGIGKRQLIYWTEYFKPYQYNFYDIRLAINIGYKF
jgi:hypothetical protein